MKTEQKLIVDMEMAQELYYKYYNKGVAEGMDWKESHTAAIEEVKRRLKIEEK